MTNDKLVTCLICGKTFKNVTNTHLKTHNLSINDYKSKYPNAILSHTPWLDSWRNSDENKNQLRDQLKLINETPSIKERRNKSLKKVYSNQAIRDLLSTKTKLWCQSEEGKRHHKNKKVTDMMKMSNYDRWLLKFGKEAADVKQSEWLEKNVQTTKSMFTQPELRVYDALNSNGIQTYAQAHFCGYYCDLIIPEYQLIIEVNGDYWHGNPKIYDQTHVVGKKKIPITEIWQRDVIRHQTIKENGLLSCTLWESDVTSSTYDKIIENLKLCDLTKHSYSVKVENATKKGNVRVLLTLQSGKTIRALSI